MSQPRVLVVEDEPVSRAAMLMRLSLLGADVVGAEDGAVALQRLRGRPFQLAIVDLSMPNVDGFSLIAAMRASSEHADLPVIVLTSEENSRNLELARSLGADACLFKPMRWTTMKSHVMPFLQRSAITAAN